MQAPDVVQLERRGGVITMSVARFGEPLTSERLDDLALGDTVYVGLFVCAHDSAATERGEFRDVRITIPAREGFTPYRDYIGARLETMDVQTGDRTLVHTAPTATSRPAPTPAASASFARSNRR